MKQLGTTLIQKAELCGITLTNEERTIATARSKVSIQNIDKHFLEAMNDKLKEVIDKFFIDCGCEPSPMLVSHIFGWVKENHANLSVSDIETAFKLFALGSFNEELHDLQHFGRINPKYVSKILNYYVTYAQERLAKVVIAQLPEPEPDIDPNESKRIAINELAQDILNHGEKGLPKTMRERRVFDWFVEVGLVKAVPEFNESDKSERVRLMRETRKVGHIRIEEALGMAESHLVREHIESEFIEMFFNFAVQEIHDRLVGEI